MESVHRIIISHRRLVIFPKITTPHHNHNHNHKCFKTKNPIFTFHGNHLLQQQQQQHYSIKQQHAYFISKRTCHSTCRAAGWFLGIGGGGDKKPKLPDIVKAGDPVLHEPAQDVPINEIVSQNIQNIIDNMIKVMRNAPGVGLAAPQIGIPFKIIVLEDTKEYISYASKEEIEAQDRRPFELLVILNPRLKKKDGKTALFFEGCLSVDGFRAVVERHVEVEVTGLDRDGRPIRVDASGWQARILQHECDHLDGTIYVDKFVPRTFRTVENLDLPLPNGCPKLGRR